MDKFLTNNYNKLYEIANKYNKRYARELISELYLYLKKYDNKNEKELLYLSIAYMRSEVNWTNSKFNKIYKIKDVEYLEDVIIIDTRVEEDIYLNSEINTSFTKEYLKDLSNDYNEQQIKKIIKVNLFLKNLMLHELILYDMWITKNHSYRFIGKKIGIPASSVSKMVNLLKKKIKENI